MRTPFRLGSARVGIALIAGLVLCSAVLISACCMDGWIKLGRIKGFLSGVFELTVEANIEGWGSVEFSGDVGAFANLQGFDADEIETDLTAVDFSLAHPKYDVDYDANKERISALRADTGGAPVVFVAWRGDEYTVDKGVCYLGWSESGEVKLAANYCGQENGAMYCFMPGANEELVYCERCTAGGACESCSLKSDLDECLPSKKDGSGIDLDIDIDIDIDIDVDLDVDEEPSVEGS